MEHVDEISSIKHLKAGCFRSTDECRPLRLVMNMNRAQGSYGFFEVRITRMDPTSVVSCAAWHRRTTMQVHRSEIMRRAVKDELFSRSQLFGYKAFRSASWISVMFLSYADAFSSVIQSTWKMAKDWRFSLLPAICYAYLVYWSIRAAYRLYYHPLAKYPGSALAAVSTEW